MGNDQRNANMALDFKRNATMALDFNKNHEKTIV
jgi:hypothetical protein